MKKLLILLLSSVSVLSCTAPAEMPVVKAGTLRAGFEQADPQDRAAYLLGQGRHAADILLFCGEDVDSAYMYSEDHRPAIPQGYDCDMVNADSFMMDIAYAYHQILSARTRTPYQLMWVDEPVYSISNTYLRKISAMAKKGAHIGGAIPQQPYCKSENEKEFRELVSEIWYDDLDNVFDSLPLPDVLRKLAVEPDFKTAAPGIQFTHRDLGKIQLYCLTQESDTLQTIHASFRQQKRKPEIWSTQTGEMTEIPFSETDNRTEVDVPLDGLKPSFVVFL